jgi:hypothetical protein
MQLSWVFDILWCWVLVFCLKMYFLNFLFLTLEYQNHRKALNKYINLMFFQAKHTFITHLNSFPNAKTNGIESVGLYEKRWLNNFYCHFAGPCSYPIDG